MARFIITLLSCGGFLGASVLGSPFIAPSFTSPGFSEPTPKDQETPNGTASFAINARPFDQVFYGMNFTFGTPPQDLILAIRPLCPVTTWVGSSNANYTLPHLFGYPDNHIGPYVFDLNASSTAQEDSGFEDFGYWSANASSEGDGRDYTDNISAGGISLGRQQINVVSEGDRSPGDICFDDLGSWLKNMSIIDEEVFSISLNGPGIYLLDCFDVRSDSVYRSSAGRYCFWRPRYREV